MNKKGISDITISFGILIALFVIITLALSCLRAIDIGFFNNIPITIMQGDEIIYEGINGCVGIVSGGDTTQVKIKSGLLCLFPKATYVGRDIYVSGEK